MDKQDKGDFPHVFGCYSCPFSLLKICSKDVIFWNSADVMQEIVECVWRGNKYSFWVNKYKNIFCIVSQQQKPFSKMSSSNVWRNVAAEPHPINFIPWTTNCPSSTLSSSYAIASVPWPLETLFQKHRNKKYVSSR